MHNHRTPQAISGASTAVNTASFPISSGKQVSGGYRVIVYLTELMSPSCVYTYMYCSSCAGKFDHACTADATPVFYAVAATRRRLHNVYRVPLHRKLFRDQTSCRAMVHTCLRAWAVTHFTCYVRSRSAGDGVPSWRRQRRRIHD